MYMLAALRYFALNGTDHHTHDEQNARRPRPEGRGGAGRSGRASSPGGRF